jgi:hypothetical protein
MAGFKINYKGTDCRGTLFLYICPSCAWEQEVTHPASKEHHEKCPSCQSFELVKKPTAPALDADYHDSCLSHNIGWDSE